MHKVDGILPTIHVRQATRATTCQAEPPVSYTNVHLLGYLFLKRHF
jgi:hypothetical protein